MFLWRHFHQFTPTYEDAKCGILELLWLLNWTFRAQENRHMWMGGSHILLVWYRDRCRMPFEFFRQVSILLPLYFILSTAGRVKLKILIWTGNLITQFWRSDLECCCDFISINSCLPFRMPNVTYLNCLDY